MPDTIDEFLVKARSVFVSADWIDQAYVNTLIRMIEATREFEGAEKVMQSIIDDIQYEAKA